MINIELYIHKNMMHVFLICAKMKSRDSKEKQ
jgi:hypothetical protein